jgi:hypothetical protein
MDEITRRTWLLRVGGGTVLTGFSGMDLSGATAAVELPPGLYTPSLNHLAHVLKAAPVSSGTAQPQFFSGDDFKLIGHLVSLILGEPATAPPVPEITQWVDLVAFESAGIRNAALALTPEHRRLAVARYGESAVRSLETDATQDLSRGGIEALRRESFFTLTETEQVSTLEALENSGDRFVLWLKQCVIDGFYTSKEGLKELDYQGNSFHSESPGCHHSGHPIAGAGDGD